MQTNRQFDHNSQIW